MQHNWPPSYANIISKEYKKPQLESLGGTVSKMSKQSILASKPKTLTEPNDFDSDPGIMSEGSRSPESYGTLDKIVIKSRKKRTRTNSQECTRKQLKRKEKLNSSKMKSLTAYDSISTSLTCKLKKFRQLKVERSISSVVSPCDQSSH